ncbi:MAG TPA: ABC transporter substrate-binding protein [Candidatus Rubrimentiphilum sp.]|nr:ABC transporter substrate-binding protein [Candidatus Rubrimentiphilum sp.]
MKRLSALAILTIFLAACGGNAGSGGNGLGTTSLVVARVKDAVILDPAQATDGMSLNLTQEMMKGLVEFKVGTFEVQPSIAQSWKMTPDGLRWTFTLKKGLKFSDGTPIDAAAVKFNFDRWRLTKSPYHQNYPYAYYADMFGGFPGIITAVEAPNPQTVVFTLSRPLGPLLRDFAMPSFAIASPTAVRRDLAGFGTHPVGYGPYVLKEWVKDDHITLTANPTWQGVKPVYTTIIVRDIPDQATSVLEMQRGGIDFLTDPRPDDAVQLAKQSGITVYQQPSNNNSYVAMNTQKAPYGKLLVRQAIAYAIDVRAIVKAFYSAGAVVASNWTPPGMLGENSSLQPYPYDPAKARQLLAQAGLPNGFSTNLYYPTIPRPYMPEPQRIAEAIQADLKKVGINVTLEGREWGVFLDQVRNGQHEMCLIGWSGDNGDPDNFFYPLLDRDVALAKPNGQNYSFWMDEAFHALDVKGQSTLDDSTRASIYRQANAMVHDQVPALPIVHTTVPVIVKSGIAGFIPSPDTHIAFEYLHPK